MGPLPPDHGGQVGGRTTPPVLQAWTRGLACAQVLGATDVLLQCPNSPATTPERTCSEMHGTTGRRHVHTDEELRRRRALPDGRSDAQALFIDLPRADDAERFLALR